jgi:hypothetical protein
MTSSSGTDSIKAEISSFVRDAFADISLGTASSCGPVSDIKIGSDCKVSQFLGEPADQRPKTFLPDLQRIFVQKVADYIVRF